MKQRRSSDLGISVTSQSHKSVVVQTVYSELHLCMGSDTTTRACARHWSVQSAFFGNQIKSWQASQHLYQHFQSIKVSTFRSIFKLCRSFYLFKSIISVCHVHRPIFRPVNDGCVTRESTGSLLVTKPTLDPDCPGLVSLSTQLMGSVFLADCFNRQSASPSIHYVRPAVKKRTAGFSAESGMKSCYVPSRSRLLSHSLLFFSLLSSSIRLFLPFLTEMLDHGRASNLFSTGQRSLDTAQKPPATWKIPFTTKPQPRSRYLALVNGSKIMNFQTNAIQRSVDSPCNRSSCGPMFPASTWGAK